MRRLYGGDVLVMDLRQRARVPASTAKQRRYHSLQFDLGPEELADCFKDVRRSFLQDGGTPTARMCPAESRYWAVRTAVTLRVLQLSGLNIAGVAVHDRESATALRALLADCPSIKDKVMSFCGASRGGGEKHAVFVENTSRVAKGRRSGGRSGCGSQPRHWPSCV